MPELPEVETTARGLRPHLVGRLIRAVEGLDWPNMLPLNEPAELTAALPAQRIEAVERRGKYLLLRLSDGGALVIHRKMSGNLLLRPGEAPWQRHTHLVLALEGGSSLHFVDPRKFGRLYYFADDAELAGFLAARLGPEPLGDLTPAGLGALLAGRRRQLKSLLLDQSFLAGLGNLYADEVLWEARLHPARTAASLSRTEVGRLWQAIREVLGRAIERRGTTLNDYVGALGEPGENQHFLEAYGRTGQPCRRCATPIERILIAQRGTWLCRRCQRLGRAGAGPVGPSAQRRLEA
jgi:formamidopyrimidine-DNA glycosylase